MLNRLSYRAAAKILIYLIFSPGQKGQPVFQTCCAKSIRFSGDVEDLRDPVLPRVRHEDHLRHVGRLHAADHEAHDHVSERKVSVYMFRQGWLRIMRVIGTSAKIRLAMKLKLKLIENAPADTTRKIR